LSKFNHLPNILNNTLISTTPHPLQIKIPNNITILNSFIIYLPKSYTPNTQLITYFVCLLILPEMRLSRFLIIVIDLSLLATQKLNYPNPLPPPPITPHPPSTHTPSPLLQSSTPYPLYKCTDPQIQKLSFSPYLSVFLTSRSFIIRHIARSLRSFLYFSHRTENITALTWGALSLPPSSF
jgi:hypothetical protein